MGSSSSSHVVYHGPSPAQIAARKAQMAAELAAAQKKQQADLEKARRALEAQQKKHEAEVQRAREKLEREQKEVQRKLQEAQAAAKAKRQQMERERKAREDQEAERREAQRRKEQLRQANRSRDKAARGMTQRNVAITGVSGAGKSTLCNTVRGLGPRDEGAAKVGVIETTYEPRRYELAGQSVFDIPGCGTADHPSLTYVEDQRLDLYDAMVVVTTKRLREDDEMLMAECKRRGIQVLLVRSGFDQDLENYADNEGVEPEDVEDECKARIKDKLAEGMRKHGHDQRDVFVIAGKLKYRTRFEMPRFEKRLQDLLRVA